MPIAALGGCSAVKELTEKMRPTNMKNTLKLAVLLALLFACGVTAQAQQNYLSQTTLAASVAGQYLGPGSTGNVPAPTLIQVASATGIVGASPQLSVTANQPNFQSALFIDREEMLVISVNGLQLTVVRGVNGTVATPHNIGAMVLAGQPRWFYVQDPGGLGTPGGAGSISNVPCVLNNVVVSPWVNIRTATQWYCSPTALVWTPGFNNAQLPIGPPAATVASVAGATNISFPVIKISGANAITSWTFTGNGAIGVNGLATANTQTGGQFCVIPTGAFTTTATNNIGAATTAIVGVEQCWVWNGPDGKWYQQP
jgi:hypothetical protein